ncbi:ankyrin repeat and KH domain-containing protein 1-like [Pollicipes pollicipes]|uniref:ankyrin repeat and KH domain-containing protein 1-like n=1 Tax=Pollicipes pollicipes TaxID=41117 RepID=UPI001884B53F|nr:ankyrin repeat and KH domain-containing protein 1-like [Pollicipes pollicipes]
MPRKKPSGPKPAAKTPTELMNAAFSGRLEEVQEMLRRKVDVNAQALSTRPHTDAVFTAMTYAIMGGHLSVVEALVEAGARLEDDCGGDGETALLSAASLGSADIVQVLLKHGANVNVVSRTKKNSALTLACERGSEDIVSLLLEAGANLEHQNHRKYTPLMAACYDRHLEVVRLLINGGAQVQGPPDSFDSPLLLAVYGNYVNIAQLLLENGADTEHVNESGYTAILEAASEGLREMTRLLISHGANVNFITGDGQSSALSMACASGYLDTARILVKAGAKVNSGCSSPLIEAACAGESEIVEWLLRHGADIRHQNSLGDTALTIAAQHDRMEVVDKLVENNADMEVLNSAGRSPLMVAAANGCFDTVEALLEWGADVNRSSPNNTVTALSLACNGGWHRTVSLLLRSGANIMHKLKDGSSALMEATLQQETKTLRVLTQYPLNASLSDDELSDDAKVESGSSKEDPDQDVKKRDRDGTTSSTDSWTEWSDYEDDDDDERSDAECAVSSGSNKPPQQSAQSASADGGKGGATSKCSRKSGAVSASGPVALTPRPKPGASAPAAASASASTSTPAAASASAPMSPVTDAQIVKKAESIKQRRMEIKVAIIQHQLEEAALDRLRTKLKQQETVTPAEKTAFVKERDRLQQVRQQFDQQLRDLEKEINEDIELSSRRKQASPSPPGIEARGRQQVVDFLVNRKAFAGQHSPLGVACSIGNPEVVNILLDSHAHIEQRDKAGFTPLMLAAGAGHTGIVLLLMDKGADAALTCEGSHDTPLMLACSGAHYDTVRVLIKTGSNLEHRNASDYTPLSMAAAAGSLEIVRFLLQQGADINSRRATRLNITPLMVAATSGQTEIVKFLLEKGCDTRAEIASNHNTALTLACFKGRLEAVDLLLQFGSHIEHRAKTGLTPLMEAAQGGFLEVGKLLLDRKAEVNAATPVGRKTVLMAAALRGHTEFVKLLISRGAKIDAQNKRGCTALWLAVDAGHKETAQLLKSHGASVDDQDAKQVSCIMAAVPQRQRGAGALAVGVCVTAAV